MTTDERKRVATIFALCLAITALVLLLVNVFRVGPGETEDALIPFLSSQVLVRESMVSALRVGEIEPFCDAYLEFLRIAKEEKVMSEGSEPLVSERDVWVVRLLAIDLYLIPDLVEIGRFCHARP